MCYIVSCYKIGDSGTHRATLEMIAKKAIYNGDGYAIIYGNRNEGTRGRVAGMKSADAVKKAEELLKDDKNAYVHVHLRARSSGENTERNLHFWDVGNYNVAHNGTCREYDRGRKESDTWQYIQRAKIALQGKCSQNTARKLDKEQDAVGLTGRVAYVHKNGSVLYHGDWELAYNTGEGLLTIASADKIGKAQILSVLGNPLELDGNGTVGWYRDSWAIGDWHMLNIRTGETEEIEIPYTPPTRYNEALNDTVISSWEGRALYQGTLVK